MSMVRAAKALELLVRSLLIGAALIYGPGSAVAQTQQDPPPNVGGAPTQDQEATAKAQTSDVTPTPPPFCQRTIPRVNNPSASFGSSQIIALSAPTRSFLPWRSGKSFGSPLRTALIIPRLLLRGC